MSEKPKQEEPAASEPSASPPGTNARPQPTGNGKGASDKGALSGDSERWKYGIAAVALALLAIVLALLIVVNKFTTSSDVGTIMGVIVSPVATIIGAYFGVSVAAEGKAKADDNAAKAHKSALHAAALISDPDKQQRFIESLT